MTSDRLGLRVAGLGLWLDAAKTGIDLAASACHTPFLASGAAGGGLMLRVRDGPLPGTNGWQSIFHDNETWQLWRDEAGRHVFVAPRDSPPRRQVAIDSSFCTGEAIGEYRANGGAGRAVYPLQDIDMAIYANWLAESGDLIVHAAGIDDAGAGYAFVGPSGAGKSTLVASLFSTSGTAAEAATTKPRTVVLGEDQVIVRYQEGRFVVYGTPWHTDPARCSPGGVPLHKLFFLDRTARHGVERCGRRAGIERLLQDAFIPYYNRAGVERILDNLLGLAEQVPFYTLGFRIGADVMGLIRTA